MTLKAPFPYFGGKRRAAPIVWSALGDPSGYVEPFAGSAAVLLARPTFTGRRVETVNDLDGWLVNTWRAIRTRPDEVAAQGVAAYMRLLAARLERVRITCGSWRRVVQPSVTLSGAGGDGARAIFLDPPYATSGDLYAVTAGGTDVASEVREWCATDAPADMRVIICGYDDEHDDLLAHGWARRQGKSGGGAGYSTRSDNGRRERLWLSPACIGHEQHAFDFGEVTAWT